MRRENAIFAQSVCAEDSKLSVSCFTFGRGRPCYFPVAPIDGKKTKVRGSCLGQSGVNSMLALMFESAKLIVMFALIGTIIGLSHFGTKPGTAKR